MVTEYLELNRPSYSLSARCLTRRTQTVLDLLALAGAFVLAYLLRFDFVLPANELAHLLIQGPLVVAIQFSALRVAGVHSFIWRYVGLSEIKAFVRGGFYSVLPLVAMRIFLPESYQGLRVPLSIIVAATVLGFMGTLGLRVLRRVYFERYEKRGNVVDLLSTRKRTSVLLIGAGRAGVQAAREIQSSANIKLKIRGFIDDDPAKQGAVIGGIKVLGTTEDLLRWILPR